MTNNWVGGAKVKKPAWRPGAPIIGVVGSQEGATIDDSTIPDWYDGVACHRVVGGGGHSHLPVATTLPCRQVLSLLHWGEAFLGGRKYFHLCLHIIFFLKLKNLKQMKKDTTFGNCEHNTKPTSTQFFFLCESDAYLKKWCCRDECSSCTSKWKI